MELNFRTEIRKSDFIQIKEIVESTGFFYDYEVPVAVELAEIAFNEGQEKSEYYFLFAEIDGTPVAYTCFGPIACTKGSFDLYWIVTHNDYRNLKIGKSILEKTHEIVKSMGGRLIIAETSGTEKYLPTRNFYLKNGYIAESIIKDFYLPGDDKYNFIFRFE